MKIDAEENARKYMEDTKSGRIETNEDIKRYEIDIEHGFTDESWLNTYEYIDGKYVKYTDHKAVVETLERLYNISNQKGNSQVDTILKLEKRIEELEAENKRIKTAEKFSIDWDAWYMSLEYLTIDKTIKVFQAREMSTSNNYTCTDFDGNEHHTRECIRLPEGLIEEWITKFDN